INGLPTRRSPCPTTLGSQTAAMPVALLHCPFPAPLAPPTTSSAKLRAQASTLFLPCHRSAGRSPCRECSLVSHSSSAQVPLKVLHSSPASHCSFPRQSRFHRSS